MTLIVTIILAVFAVVLCLARANEVDGGPFGGLEFFPEERAPADDFGDGVSEGHVPDSGVLGGGGEEKGDEWQELEGYHGGRMLVDGVSFVVSKALSLATLLYP